MKVQTKTECFLECWLKNEVGWFIGPATKVGEELMGIPSFDTPDYSELFAEERHDC
jgi:hypothetical protein